MNILMKCKRRYVQLLFNAIDVFQDESLSSAERNHRIKVTMQIITAIKSSFGLDAADENGETLFTLAARKGNTAVVEALMDANADANKADETGATPLICASREGHAATVGALLRAKVDPNNGDEKTGETPLILAAEEGHTATAKALLAAKADPNKADKEGNTPLIIASENGHTVTVETLLAAKADPNKTENEGETSLMLASEGAYTAMAAALLEAKADVNLLNAYGRSALDYAVNEAKNVFMVHLLLKSHAGIHNFKKLRTFLLSQDLNDPYVLESFRIMQKHETIQIEKLRSLNNAYEIYFSYFLRETTLPKNVTNLVLAYDGRFFKSKKLSPINILEPSTINDHLTELKKEILKKTKRTPGLFNANAIQEIDKALALRSDMLDISFSTRMTGS